MNEYLPDGIISVHDAFTRDAIPHAFGGAIALAYSGIPRYTHDIDINVFLSVEHHGRVLSSLSSLFPIPNLEQTQRQLAENAQARLRWGDLPVDVYLANLEFHGAMASRVKEVDYVGTIIPVLSAEDLIICKAAFNRPKDWVDIENMFQVQHQNLDAQYIRHWLTDFFEHGDERVVKVEGYIRGLGRGMGPERQ